MTRPASQKALPSAQRMAAKAFDALEHFLHIEAVGGIVLLAAAAVALIWANTTVDITYEAFWHLPLDISFAGRGISYTLHFWINDILMTIFFLVVGMEIRREMHDGALADLRQAALPCGAALGGVAVPAMIFLAINSTEELRRGWAVPTATDIDFAVGVLALLGRSIPSSVRVFLLALAIIDDIVAVIIIALFYSNGLDPQGFMIAGVGIAMVLFLQWIGIGAAYAFVIPGAVLWFGLHKAGAHPTLAGVILGLMTPVHINRSVEHSVGTAQSAIKDFAERKQTGSTNTHELMRPVKQLKHAQRELLPPVVRVQMALHPWVAFGIMPLFALANAGVNLKDIEFASDASAAVMIGVSLALVFGKPLGVVLMSWLLVRFGGCRLPDDMNWRWVLLIGCLAGIGFTMSIFIAGLAFADKFLLDAAKLGVLAGSTLAGLIGLIYGFLLKQHRAQ